MTSPTIQRRHTKILVSTPILHVLIPSKFRYFHFLWNWWKHSLHTYAMNPFRYHGVLTATAQQWHERLKSGEWKPATVTGVAADNPAFGWYYRKYYVQDNDGVVDIGQDMYQKCSLAIGEQISQYFINVYSNYIASWKCNSKIL